MFINVKNLIGIMSYLLNENYLRILEYIADKKEFTEREIKRQLKIKEEEIRKLLYILEENNIVYPISIINNNGKFDFRWGNRVQDKEKLFRLLINKEINRINEEIKKYTKKHYIIAMSVEVHITSMMHMKMILYVKNVDHY